jgi:hypothetical protein
MIQYRRLAMSRATNVIVVKRFLETRGTAKAASGTLRIDPETKTLFSYQMPIARVESFGEFGRVTLWVVHNKELSTATTRQHVALLLRFVHFGFFVRFTPHIGANADELNNYYDNALAKIAGRWNRSGALSTLSEYIAEMQRARDATLHHGKYQLPSKMYAIAALEGIFT